MKCKKWTGGLSDEVQGVEVGLVMKCKEWTGGLSDEVQGVDWWA